MERDPSTSHRELALNRDGAYDAEAAQAAAAARARRPKTPKLAADAALAATVGALLAHRMSPHAISALVAGEGASIAAETIYRACYDHSGRRGLVGGGREPPRPALLEPYVSVSGHMAPTVRRGVEAGRCQ